MSRTWEAEFFAAAAKVADALPFWEKPPDLQGLQEALLVLIRWAGEDWVAKRPELFEGAEQPIHAGFSVPVEPTVRVYHNGKPIWFSADKAWALVRAGDPTTVPTV